MDGRHQRGPRLYRRGTTFWISYPASGTTRRRSTGTRDPVVARAVLESRRREIRATAGDEEVICSCGGTLRPDRPLPTPSGHAGPVPVPTPLLALAVAVVQFAKDGDVNGTILVGLKLARVIRNHKADLYAIPAAETD